MAVELEIRALGMVESENWCETCLLTTAQVTLFLRIGQDAQTIRWCIRGEHRLHGWEEA